MLPCLLLEGRSELCGTGTSLENAANPGKRNESPEGVILITLAFPDAAVTK
jgi:hypothetical protein